MAERSCLALSERNFLSLLELRWKCFGHSCPSNHQQKKEGTFCQVNPIPYRAYYFGHKMHFDQNEKLVMYGVTHVVSVDGHSRFITGAYTMPMKNNLVIYEDVFRYVSRMNKLYRIYPYYYKKMTTYLFY